MSEPKQRIIVVPIPGRKDAFDVFLDGVRVENLVAINFSVGVDLEARLSLEIYAPCIEITGEAIVEENE